MNPNTPEAWDTYHKNVMLRPSTDVWVVQRITKVSSLVPQNSTVLDVASGPGIISNYFDKSIKYTPLDFSIEALKLFKGSFILADLLTYDFGINSFSTILAMEILEHLDNPDILIKKLGFASSYQVIFTVPNNSKPPGVSRFHVDIFTVSKLVSLVERSYPFSSIKTFTVGCSIICQCLI